jgi:hypothetical protein
MDKGEFLHIPVNVDGSFRHDKFPDKLTNADVKHRINGTIHDCCVDYTYHKFFFCLHDDGGFKVSMLYKCEWQENVYELGELNERSNIVAVQNTGNEVYVMLQTLTPSGKDKLHLFKILGYSGRKSVEAAQEEEVYYEDEYN